jgi:hypothetical protein
MAANPESEYEPVRSVVDDMLDQAVAKCRAGKEIVVSTEAEWIIRTLRKRDPDALAGWFEEHLIAILGQHLQVRLASRRRASRVGVSFGGLREVESEFESETFHTGVSWKVLGDMRRPDWQHVLDDRVMRVKPSLFEIARAKLLIARLPDDETLTRDVVSESELEALDEQATKTAAKWMRGIAA